MREVQMRKDAKEEAELDAEASATCVFDQEDVPENLRAELIVVYTESLYISNCNCISGWRHAYQY